MKKSILLLFLIILCFKVRTQSLLDQEIHLSKSEYEIFELFDEISSQKDLSFSFGRLKTQSRVVFDSSVVTIREALDQALDLDIYRYKTKGKKILIYPASDQKEETHIIRGYVSDEEEKLAGARVILQETGKGMSTNTSGYFSIETTLDSCSLRITYVGYQAQEIPLSHLQNQKLNIQLTPKHLNEVVVETQKEPVQIEISSTEMGTFHFTPKMIEDRPIILGEPDVLKTLQLLPGVQNGHEGTSGLYVRGGGPDQNLILLDGVPMYNTSHLFGFVSSFNTNSISEMKLIKGAFPARYGGRLSSVLDISLKEGDKEKIHGNASIGLVTSHATLEGPIFKDKTSFIVSARRTYLDLIAAPLMQTQSSKNGSVKEKNTTSFNFYDINAKITHQLNKKDFFNLIIYRSQDKVKIQKQTTKKLDVGTRTEESVNFIQWSNTMSNLNWRHIYGEKINSLLSLSYMDYKLSGFNSFFYQTQYSDTTEITYKKFTGQSGIQDYSIKLDFTFDLHNNNIRFGTSSTIHQYTPNLTTITYNQEDRGTSKAGKLESIEYDLYLEDDITISSWFKANLGLHASAFKIDSTYYSYLQPRLALNFIMSPRFSTKAAYSKMSQYIHLLTHSSVGLPTDIWVPVTANIRPQLADQVSLGFYYTQPAKRIEISLEGYYKEMRNILEYEEGSTFLGKNQVWEDKVTSGIGDSYGVELFIKKKINQTSGWIGYTFSYSNRTVDEINNGNSFPYKWDRRHDLKLVLNHQINDKIFLGANWVYASGFAISLPTTEYIFKYPENYYRVKILNYPEKNGYRMRPYHRLDLSIRFYKKKNWGERNWIISIYNTYNRKNPFYVSNSDYDSSNIIKEATLFPIIPSINYQIKF